MNVFSRNIGLICKTFLYQIVMSIFGLMMYGATNQNAFLLILGAASVILFFLFIMSSQMFQAGGKNCEFDRAHGQKSSPFLGFLFALVAFLPTILLCLWSISFPPFAANGDPLGTGYIPFLLNKSFLQGMYVSIHQACIPTVQGTDALNSQPLLQLFSTIPGILFAGAGYWIGYRSFTKEKKKK